jgi:hypothetical protein
MTKSRIGVRGSIFSFRSRLGVLPLPPSARRFSRRI